MRRALSLPLAVAAALSAAAVPATAAAATRDVSLSGFDNRLVHDIQVARADHGLPAVAVAAGTTDVAHAWSCTQARDHALEHNPDVQSQVADHGSPDWHRLDENVGQTTADADTLFAAYMDSPEHRSNILDPDVRYLGIWTTTADDGTQHNTIDLVDSYDTSYGPTRVTC